MAREARATGIGRAGAKAADYSRSVGRWARGYPLAPRYRSHEHIELRTVDGVRLSAIRLAGPSSAGSTVVLVHGLLNNARSPRIFAFARTLQERVNVVVPDLRGHGASGGVTTLGLLEPYDVAASVDYGSSEWGLPVVSVGSSLGGAAALRHAGLIGGVAGVVSVSAPAWPNAADLPGSARAQRFVRSPAGRRLAASFLRTRIADACEEVPDASAVVPDIAPAFVVVAHDPADHYFGEDHARAIHDAAREPKALWLLPGTGHGTDLMTPDFAHRVVDEIERRRPTMA